MTSDSDDALSWEGDDHATPRRPGRPRQRETAASPVDPAPVGASSLDDAEIDDPTADASTVPAPSGDRAVMSESAGTAGRAATPSAVAVEDDDAPAGLSNAMLLLVGVVGGIYLLYSIGWIVGGLRLQPLASFLVADAMFLPWFVLAIAAPALWFLATWVLTRGRAAWVRVVLLLAGVVLLVPWPFVTVGVVGS
ncbi:hypothetical protein [Microbacterium paraoxydans]|nr:hypothetical protein [Microbacterium paraoxydans]